MKIPCYFINILIDKVNDKIVAHPKIFQSVITDTNETHYIVQKSLTNAHLTMVRKDWVFLSESKAQEYLKEHAQELYDYAEYVKNVYKPK